MKKKSVSRSWLQDVILVGKTVGGFGLLLLYLAIPKPYLASQFATLSLTRGLSGKSPSEVEKGLIVFILRMKESRLRR